MHLPGEEGARFKALWPLHRLRYLLVLAGVAAWLWESAWEETLLSVALLLSLLLLVELLVHGPARPRGVLGWCALQCALALVALHLAPGYPVALILCAVLAGTGALLEPAVSWSLFAAVALLAGLPFWRARAPGEGFASVGAWAISVWLGRLFASRLEEVQAHRRTVSELEAAQARLAHLAETRKALAAAQTREKLASAIHDSLGHALIGTLLQVRLAKELVSKDPGAAVERLDLVEASVRETLGRVRRLLAQGRHDREGLALHAALGGLASEIEAAGGPAVELRFTPDAEGISDVSDEVSRAIYQTVQEALTNAVRHGNARRVTVDLEAAGPRLYVRIADDGDGADSYTPGMGLSGMVSRIQAVGGTLRFHTAPGEGFQIEVGVRRR